MKKLAITTLALLIIAAATYLISGQRNEKQHEPQANQLIEKEPIQHSAGIGSGSEIAEKKVAKKAAKNNGPSDAEIKEMEEFFATYEPPTKQELLEMQQLIARENLKDPSGAARMAKQEIEEAKRILDRIHAPIPEAHGEESL